MILPHDTAQLVQHLNLEIAAIMHFIHSDSVPGRSLEAEGAWVHARQLQQAASDLGILAAAIEVLVRRTQMLEHWLP